jgi:PhzF family phenazine biosynthesis protein
MNEYNYKRIDAFTSGNSSGNPAGVVYLRHDETISEEQMQAIARQEKGIVSEVVFCRPLKPDLYELKYYSSECEVEFCGHGTIACMYELIKNDSELMKYDTFTIRTSKGDLPVFNEISRSDSVFITAPVPQYIGCRISRQEIADSLGISIDRLNSDFDADIINGGLITLLVPVKSLDDILKLYPDFDKLQQFCLSQQVDIVLVFSSEVYDINNRFRTRVFAPKYGYLEDPATGSGNSAFGYYLLQRDLWDGSGIISIEQGPSRDNPNVVKLGSKHNRELQQVIFGGGAKAR